MDSADLKIQDMHVTATPTTFADPSAAAPVQGLVLFSLNRIGVRQTVTIVIDSAMRSDPATTSSVGAHVFGTVPDPNGGNNFRAVAATGG